MRCKGVARVDRRTKNLLARLRPGDIAVVDHEDIDVVACESLVAAGVRAVVNARRSMSGRYPNPGPISLCRAGVYIVDEVGREVLDLVRDGDLIELEGNSVVRDGTVVSQGRIQTLASLERELGRARKELARELDAFVSNTIEYARREKSAILGGLAFPPLRTRLVGRHALVVVRGRDYKEDLRAIRSYIEEVRPAIIAVDGAADALLEMGFFPDVIVGDMDSVSDDALRRGSELVVHAYSDGRAPGLDRIKRLGLEAAVCPVPGTSEDLGMLLAYENGAELIVAVGTHTSVEDFLDKGRPGMASTFLTRLKLGSLLVDAKGVSKLYTGRVRVGYVILLVIAALVPLALAGAESDMVRQILRLLLIRLRLDVGLL
ncbi:MAG: putative cytokinetic ring protein SteA [Firmicutes bacterium]|nr:putative cytokinetic ring protein SteA [Bacillota bacterium]MDH7495627.1 putative cytokinetic ring protein SteA [Bacillota bacterium]